MDRAPATLQDLPPEIREIVEALLAEKVVAFQTLLAEKNALVEKLGTDLEKLRHQFDLLIKKMFGRSSEKLDPNQLLLEGLMLQAQDTFAPVLEKPEFPAKPSPISNPSKRNGRMPIPEHLKRNEFVIEPPESEKVCPVTGEPRPCIGEEVTEKYHYVRETLEVNRYIRKKYGSPMGAEENGVVIAPPPPSLLPRCLADASMLSHIAVSKFDDHLPLYRLEKMFARQGAPISRKTMSDWMRNLAEGLQPLEKRIAELILECGVTHHDDTPVKRLDPGAGQTKESRVWVAVSGQGPPLVRFSFTPDRKQKHVVDFFRGYGGAIMCDEYAGYANTDHGVMQSCWAHARRKIYEGCVSQPGYRDDVLREITKLYAIEAKIRDQSAEERSEARRTESREQLAKVFKAVESKTFTPGSEMGKAQYYVLAHRKQLCAFAEDQRLPIDNNPAERAIRRVAVGRKNWMFLGSETGGETAATLMTLLGSCWANRVNAQAYLEDVIRELPGKQGHELDTLLPHVWLERNPEARLPEQN